MTLTRRSLLLWGRNMCAEKKKEEAWVGDKSLRLVFRSALLPRPFLTEHVELITWKFKRKNCCLCPERIYTVERSPDREISIVVKFAPTVIDACSTLNLPRNSNCIQSNWCKTVTKLQTSELHFDAGVTYEHRSSFHSRSTRLIY